MELHQPSRTAQGAAMHRAAHQLVDTPPVFCDPLAVRIIGEEAAAELREGRDRRTMTESSGLRTFIAIRSRFAEDCLDEAITRGVRQYVLLGAGLDTFAYRASREGLCIFEVDHPATQAWKRQRLAECGIAIPASVIYTPVDFERETLHEGLARARFDLTAPGMFAWLGVTPYLTPEAVTNTLTFVATLPRGTEIVFDYAEPPENRDSEHSRLFRAMAERVAASGEPFKCFFEPETLVRTMKALGFSHVEDMDRAALNARYFHGRVDGLQLRGRAHLMHARV
jgi:methyltransferase (TIGR00027 family)